MEGEPVLPKLEREQEQDEPFLDSAALTPTEEVASAFRQIKGATVTVIKRSKKDSKKQGRKAKKVKLIITSKKSTVLEDKEETPKKKTTKPKKVKLVITGKRRDDPKPAKPVSPPLNPPDWPDFDEEEEHEEDEDLENAYFDEDEFDPNEVLRKAELDRASRKHKQDEKSSLESDLQIKEENLLADGASNVPPDSVVDDIKIEGEDVFQSPDFYPDPVEDEDDEEELVPKKRSRRAPKRHRAVEDEEDFEDLELRNELAELNGLEPPLGKKRKRGPGRPPKNDQAPRTRGTKTVGPAALEEYEGEIEMTAVTLDAYVVNKAGKKTFPRYRRIFSKSRRNRIFAKIQ